jgi:hypothetical protein
MREIPPIVSFLKALLFFPIDSCFLGIMGNMEYKSAVQESLFCYWNPIFTLIHAKSLTSSLKIKQNKRLMQNYLSRASGESRPRD